MASKASTKLFKLIKSLTPSEKRHFTLYANRIGGKNEDKNYVILFDILNKQMVYDEIALQKTLAKVLVKSNKATNEKQLLKNLARGKVHLRDLILDSLHDFYAKSSVDENIKKMIHQAEILAQRDFVEDSLKLLEKAQKLAFQHEHFALVLEALRQKRLLYKRSTLKTIDEKVIAKLHQEETECIHIMHNTAKYYQLLLSYYHHLFKKGTPEKIKQSALVTGPLTDDLLDCESKALSLEARICFYHIKAAYAFAERNVVAAWQNNAAGIALFNKENSNELDMKKLALYPNEYLATFNNYLLNCHILGKYSDFLKDIRSLRNIRKKKE